MVNKADMQKARDVWSDYEKRTRGGTINIVAVVAESMLKARQEQVAKDISIARNFEADLSQNSEETAEDIAGLIEAQL